MTPVEEARYIQRCRIAAKYFLKFCNTLKINIVNNPYYDLFVEDSQNGLSFGIKVIENGYLESQDFKERYLASLRAIDNFNYYPRVPIALLNVDETTETGTCGVILSLNLNGATIKYPLDLKDLNDKEHFERMMNEINISDYFIRTLREERMGFLKTISFKISGNRYGTHSKEREAFAKVVYKRDFTNNYKMNPPTAISEKERFDRALHGTPQDEYPNDELDEVIFNAIGSKFESPEKRSSIILFNTELRDLKSLYKDKLRKQLTIQVEPKLDDQAILLLGGVFKCPRINLSIFVENPFFNDLFSDELILQTFDLKEWQSVYEEITRLMPTLTDLSKLID